MIYWQSLNWFFEQFVGLRSLLRNDVGSLSRFNIDGRTRPVSDSIKGKWFCNCDKFVDGSNVWHRNEEFEIKSLTEAPIKKRFSFSFDEERSPMFDLLLESNEENFFSIRKRKDSSRRQNLSSDNERLFCNLDWTRQWKYCDKAPFHCEGKNDQLGRRNRRSIFRLMCSLIEQSNSIVLFIW